MNAPLSVTFATQFTTPISPQHLRLAEVQRQSLGKELGKNNSEFGDRVYRNVLSVLIAHDFLQILGLSSTWQASQVFDPAMSLFFDVADLLVPGVGRIECRAVKLGETEVVIPPETWDDRCAYLAIALPDSMFHISQHVEDPSPHQDRDQTWPDNEVLLDESDLTHRAIIAGFVPSVSLETLPLDLWRSPYELAGFCQARQSIVTESVMPELIQSTQKSGISPVLRISEWFSNVSNEVNNLWESLGWEKAESLLLRHAPHLCAVRGLEFRSFYPENIDPIYTNSELVNSELDSRLEQKRFGKVLHLKHNENEIRLALLINVFPRSWQSLELDIPLNTTQQGTETTEQNQKPFSSPDADDFGVRVRLEAIEPSHWPENLTAAICNENGLPVMQMIGSDRRPIAFQFGAILGERFSILVSLDQNHHREVFFV